MGNNQNDNNNNNVNDKNNNINKYNDMNNIIIKNTNSIEMNTKIKKRKYVWIDPSVDNEVNRYNYKKLFTDRGINCKTFDNINDLYTYLTERKNNFKEFVIIISGKLFNRLYHKIKNNIQSIKFSPTILIFTGQEGVNSLINQLKMNNLYYNNNLFNSRYIFTSQTQIGDFIDNKIQEENDLTFDIIDNLDQLIIPNYYSNLLDDVRTSEISSFNSYLKIYFKPPTEEERRLNENNPDKLVFKNGNINIQNLIDQIEDKKANAIIIKYWLRIYSLQSEFFNELNQSLRKKVKNISLYYPFIKLCYEGVKKAYFKSYEKEIYRCSKIDKNEFIEISQRFEQNNNNSKDIPKFIIFSRSFLSFSLKRENAYKFKGASSQTFSILYTLENIKNQNNNQNYIPNAYMEEFSASNDEEEVLVFPFSCFEIIKIKEVKKNKIDYEINLKYLGNYSNIFKEQFGNNFLDKIQISNFSLELLNSGILNIKNIFTTWEQKEETKIKFDKVCFFLENNSDILCFKNNEIFVFNIYFSRIKQTINIHEKQILDIVKLTNNRICSCSEDETIKIINITDNNTKYNLLHNIYLNQKYSTQIKFLSNEDIILVDNEDNIIFYVLRGKKYIYDKSIKEENKIISNLKFVNGRILYITENKEGKKLINFLNLIEKEKEKDFIKIKEKEEEKKLKLIDLLLYHDYILIVYDYQIDFINYKQSRFKIRSIKFFDFAITNFIILSSNRIILGLYDSDKKESIIRENILNTEDLKNNLDKFDCIGEGILKNEMIENIVKIKDSQIGINIKNNSFIIYERKNEISEKLKESLKVNNKIEENNINFSKTNTLTDEVKIDNLLDSNFSINNPLEEDENINKDNIFNL